MIFNWILINKFAIGTPVNCKEDLLILKKSISSVLDLRNNYDFNKSLKKSFLLEKGVIITITTT